MMTDAKTGKGNGATEATAIPTSYAATFAIQVAQVDIRLTFGLPHTVERRGAQHGLDLAMDSQWYHTICMSPQSAKQLSQLLVRNIAEYEKNVGPIEGVDLPTQKQTRKTTSRKKK